MKRSKSTFRVWNSVQHRFAFQHLIDFKPDQSPPGLKPRVDAAAEFSAEI
jgi:hypothetical protein